MILVEKHDYKRGHRFFDELDDLCFKSKNIYNSTLYHVRQHFFKTHMETGKGEYLSFNKINKLAKELMFDDYTALPAKVAQQTQRNVDQNFRSFFALLHTNPHMARIPKYLPKDGRFVVTYTKQAVSFKNRNVPEGYVWLSGTNILIKTKVDDVQSVRVVPKSDCITVEICYNVTEKEWQGNGRYASIDLGVDNLATIVSNVFAPILFRGRKLRSINHYYSKKIASLQSRHKRKTHTKRMKSITRKRNNKVNDFMHKASRMIANHLAENRICTLIVGYNKGWKQDANMGKVQNQGFEQIPFLKFVQMLEYKCALLGIKVVRQEESYTSKCSFIDGDYIPTFGIDGDKLCASGRRITRGLYRTASGLLIHADINGAYNIMRKALSQNAQQDAYLRGYCLQVCSTPSVFTVKHGDIDFYMSHATI